jgi:chromosome segregation ATPase
MSGLDQLMRLQKWTLDEKRRQALDLESLIDKFETDIRLLDEEVIREIDAAQQSIELQRTLPAYRKMMQERRERLEQSIDNLRVELARIQDEIAEAFSELKKTEQTIQSRKQRQRQQERRREQIVSDDIGLELHRRRRSSES